MPIIDEMELPITTLKIQGPAVRAEKERLEDNDHARAEVARFRAVYEPVREKTLQSIAALASI
jgi:hypothetical protein